MAGSENPEWKKKKKVKKVIGKIDVPITMYKNALFLRVAWASGDIGNTKFEIAQLVGRGVYISFEDEEMVSYIIDIGDLLKLVYELRHKSKIMKTKEWKKRPIDLDKRRGE